MAHTFVVVGNLFVITIDGIPFILHILAFLNTILDFVFTYMYSTILFHFWAIRTMFPQGSQFVYDRYVFCVYNQSIQKSHLNSSCHGGDMNYLYLLSFLSSTLASINTTSVVLSISLVKHE